MTEGLPDKEKNSRQVGFYLKLALKISAIAIVLFALIMASSTFRQYVDLERFLSFVKSTGPMAPLVYCGIYLIGPTIFLPASILTMAGGALFGPVMGTIYTIFSATLGATLPFMITRKFGRGPLEKTLSKYENFDEKFRKFEASVEEDGWKYVAFTRLVTLFPFLLLNYAFGLTKIRLWTYIWASFIFMLPASFVFTYIGYAGRQALSGSEDSIKIVSIAVGCVLVLSAIPKLANKFKTELESEE